jgi:hypothetical protein
MKKELTGSMVFDTGTLLEMLFSTPNGIKTREALKAGSQRKNMRTNSSRNKICALQKAW